MRGEAQARGHEIAARYVAAQFEAIGLKPAGQEGAYFQRVPLRQLTVEAEKCAVGITENGSITQLKWGDDFLMRGNEVYPDSSIEAPVVFVGYGVRTPDGSYDDYAGVDVKGKIVALLGRSTPFASLGIAGSLERSARKVAQGSRLRRNWCHCTPKAEG